MFLHLHTSEYLQVFLKTFPRCVTGQELWPPPSIHHAPAFRIGLSPCPLLHPGKVTFICKNFTKCEVWRQLWFGQELRTPWPMHPNHNVTSLLKQYYNASTPQKYLDTCTCQSCLTLILTPLVLPYINVNSFSTLIAIISFTYLHQLWNQKTLSVWRVCQLQLSNLEHNVIGNAQGRYTCR